MQLPRLFVRGYQELKRPQNVVDETLMTRIEEARTQLRLQGKDVTPVLGRGPSSRKPMPAHAHKETAA